MCCSLVAIGLSNGICRFNSMPGWYTPAKWGYHGDDGGVYINQGDLNTDRNYGLYEKDDTIGCGVDDDGYIFYTKNGARMG